MKAFNLVIVCVLACTTGAFADDILGKRITFKTQFASKTLRVLGNGHILMTDSTNNCRASGGGETGGEAKIGETISREFICARGGKQTNYRLEATASYNGGELSISQKWTETTGGQTYSNATPQTLSLRVDGRNCSGTWMGTPISNCVVK